MAVNRNFFNLYNMMGTYRNLLSSRIILPIYQPVATLKKSLEEMIGLPRKPRRPLTPYFRYLVDVRPNFMKKNPDLKLVEVTKILAQEWNKYDEQSKAKYLKGYQQSLEEYAQAKVAYFNTITKGEKQVVKTAKLEDKHGKEERHKRKVDLLIKSLGKPKRPGSAFALWVTSLHAKRGNMKLSEYIKSWHAKWEILPEKEREPFELKAAEAMKIYRQDLKQWEKNMSKTANHDLIKYGTYINQKPAVEKKENAE